MTLSDPENHFNFLDLSKPGNPETGKSKNIN